MTDSEFEKLKADEAEAYRKFLDVRHQADDLSGKWLPIKQRLDRENLRREIAAEMREESK